MAKDIERIDFTCPHCKGTIRRKITEPPIRKCPWCRQEMPEVPEKMKDCEWPGCGGKLPICGTSEECKLHLGEAKKKKKSNLTPGKKEIQKVRGLPQ